MNLKLKRTIIALSIISLTGCATIADTTSSLGRKMGVTNETGAAATGGGVIGCAAGGFLGYITGVGVAKGCAGGALIGASVSAFSSTQKQLDNAKAFAADLKAHQIQATLVEKTITVPSDSDKSQTKQQQALDRLNIKLPRKLLEAHDPDIESLVKRATALGTETKDKTVTFIVSGRKAEAEWVRSVITSAVPAGVDNVNIVVHELKSNRKAELTITHIPVKPVSQNPNAGNYRF